MEGHSRPQRMRRIAPQPTYAGRAMRRTLRGMDVQITPRPSRIKVRFPNAIREYRLKAGLSQQALASMLGRSKDAVSSWERGLNLPSVPVLLRMAKILGTLAESLYRDFYQTLRQEEAPQTPIQ